MKRLALTASLIALLVGGLGGAQQNTVGPHVTIYRDVALIEELRTLSSSEELRIENLPTAILADSVLFRPLQPGFTIVEQEFLPAQAQTGFLLLKDSIGQEVEVTVSQGLMPKTYRGTLLNIDDGIVLQDVTGKVQIIREYSQISLAQLPQYRKSPALRWRVQNDSSRDVQGYLSYLTGGLSWIAHYTAVLNEQETQMKLSSWVTIENRSGREYPNAKLTLIAGELRRVTPPPVPILPRAFAVAPQAAAEKDVETEPTFEYHEYKFPRPTTLKDNQTLQLAFLRADSITVSKHYVYEAAISPQVRVEIRFANDEPSGLGGALPAGVVRLYKETKGLLQLIGEDFLAHTPKNERVTLTPGMAFDLKADRIFQDRQVVARDAMGRETYRDSYEILLRNQKDSDVVIEVKERLQGTWKIVSADPVFEKLDVNTILFRASVKPGGTTKVTYIVEWKH